MTRRIGAVTLAILVAGAGAIRGQEPNLIGRSIDGVSYSGLSFLQHQRSSHDPPVLTGNVLKGKAVFEKHKCATCHWTGPTGGRRGTDLSVSRGRLDYVRKAIVNPGTDVDREYQQVVLVASDGRILQGMRLSENSFYLQLIDEQDRLYTVAKAAIDELKRPTQSLMPSFENELSPEELEDLIAYVFSLRKE